MEQNKILNETLEQVVLTPNPRRIEIHSARPARAYGLFDSETGTQVTGFKKGTEGKVEFAGLNPSKHYDVGAIEGMGDEKPQFKIIWTAPMRDETDEILKNSGNLPVVFTCTYHIIDNGNNNVFDMVDTKGKKVGKVMKLSPTGDKPRFVYVHTFTMKDDTQK